MGEAPSDLIRRVRLSRAAKLIENKFGNISEIALEVGFANPANFANSFRRQFNVSPSEYEIRLKN
ncbi:MAG: helix-turn-helix transcriptional regulator [Ignavibacteriaceae bacterium]|nr:helix-turn-helix transcriptional regulator [Ignavibacteriaceae bacterium]